MRALAIRSFKRKSTHAVLRFRFNHLKDSIINDTFPKMMELCYPHVPYNANKTDWYHEFENGSKILYGGLDEKERTEKILGQEHSSIFLNEVSQISYDSRNKAVTRLAQNSGLTLKAYYDANPPSAAHWTYRMFMKKAEPKSGLAFHNPENYATMQMNPIHNLANLPPGYMDELQNLPERERKRFLSGEFLSELPGALWGFDTLERNRIAPDKVPYLQRIVIAVDPSGCYGEEDKRSDEVGIVACGLGIDKKGYVLEDASGYYSPEGWAQKTLELFDLYHADRIIAEKNFGGAMVEHTIRTARRNAPVRTITASRGKVQRAEPVSALYEKNNVKHVGFFPEMEDQMLSFTTHGYEGTGSPDRADAAVWGLSELMVKLGFELSVSHM